MAARTAFTLIELVIVLVLIGISGAVVLPALLRAATPNGIDAASAPVVQLLQFAERTSSTRDVRVVVLLDPATAAYRAAAVGDDSAFAAGTLELAPTVHLASDSIRARFIFQPDGSAYGDSLLIDAGGTAAVVHVDPWNGAIRVAPR